MVKLGDMMNINIFLSNLGDIEGVKKKIKHIKAKHPEYDFFFNIIISDHFYIKQQRDFDERLKKQELLALKESVFMGKKPKNYKTTFFKQAPNRYMFIAYDEEKIEKDISDMGILPEEVRNVTTIDELFSKEISKDEHFLSADTNLIFINKSYVDTENMNCISILPSMIDSDEAATCYPVKLQELNVPSGRIYSALSMKNIEVKNTVNKKMIYALSFTVLFAIGVNVWFHNINDTLEKKIKTVKKENDVPSSKKVMKIRTEKIEKKIDANKKYRKIISDVLNSRPSEDIVKRIDLSTEKIVVEVASVDKSKLKMPKDMTVTEKLKWMDKKKKLEREIKEKAKEIEKYKEELKEKGFKQSQNIFVFDLKKEEDE